MIRFSQENQNCSQSLKELFSKDRHSLKKLETKKPDKKE
jgi:hypothetical protein